MVTFRLKECEKGKRRFDHDVMLQIKCECENKICKGSVYSGYRRTMSRQMFCRTSA